MKNGAYANLKLRMTPTALMTVEQAREQAERFPDRRYELHHGELVERSNPKLGHQLLRRHLAKLLEARTADHGLVYVEFGFRALPEYDSRRADVALIAHRRLAEAELVDEFFGAPDLVVEVLSPSNRAVEMEEKESLCLANGCLSFWVVNPLRESIRVSQSSQVSRYELNDSIPLQPFGTGALALGQLFASRT